MEYIPIKGTIYEVKCELINGKYNYILRKDGGEPYSAGKTTKEPLEITKTSGVGKFIFNPLKNKEYSAVNDEQRNEKRELDFRNILGKLD